MCCQRGHIPVGTQLPRQAATLWVNSAETEQRRGQETTTPKKDRKQRTCMGTECGLLLPVQKWEKRDSCGSLVLPAPPTPFLAPPTSPASVPSFLCSSYTGLPTTALAHVCHSARNILPIAASSQSLPTATLAPHLASGRIMRKPFLSAQPRSSCLGI